MRFLAKILLAIVILHNLLINVQAAEIKILRVSDGKTVSPKEMIKGLKDSDVIFLGEIHGYESIHHIQLEIIKGLSNSKLPLSIGLEMFTSESQDVLDQWIKGTIPAESFINAYYRDWDIPWAYYSDIFLYLREKTIPAIGLNVSKEISRKVASKGFSSLNKKETEVFPPGVTCSVDKRYMDFIRSIYGAHRNGNRQFVNFCESQLMKDKAMAWRISGYLEKNPGRKIVVLTGANHAWKQGIPKEARKLLKDLRCTVILPKLHGREISSDDADYILTSEKF